MSKKVPQYQVDMLNDVLNHLDPSASGFHGSDAVRAALSDPALRNYLRSWVLPNLVALRDGDVRPYMRRAAATARHYDGTGGS